MLGGEQLRPNIHIEDMINSYLAVLKSDYSKINGEIFNVGFKNQSVNELAMDVKKVIGKNVEITKKETNDNRSYHVSSQKIKDILDFETKFTIQDAVRDLKKAFDNKLLFNSFENKKYFNIKMMQSIKLK